MMKKGFIIFGAIAVTVLGVLATPIIYTAVKTPKIKNVEVTQVDEKTESFSLQFDVDKKVTITKVFLSNEQSDSFISISALEKDSSFFSSSYVANFNIPLEEKDTFTVSGFFNNKGEKINFGNKEKIEINYGKVFNLTSVSLDDSFDYCDSTLKYNIKIDSPRKYSPEKLVYTFNGVSDEAILEGKSPFSIELNSDDFIFDFKIQGIKYNSQESEKLFETSFNLITNREEYKKSIVKNLTFPSGLFAEDEESFGKLELEKNKYGIPQSVSISQDGFSSTVNVENSQETPSSLFISFKTTAKSELKIKSINYQNANYPTDSSFPLSPENYINPNLFSIWGDKKIFKDITSNFFFSTGRTTQSISLSSLKITFLNKKDNSSHNFNYDTSSFSNGKISISEENPSFKNFMEENIKLTKNLNTTFEISFSDICLNYKNTTYDSIEMPRKMETTLSELSFVFKECSDGTPLSNFNDRGVTFIDKGAQQTVEINISLLSPYSLPSSTSFSLSYEETCISSGAITSQMTFSQEVSQNSQNKNFIRGIKTFEDGSVEYKINLSLQLSENCIVFTLNLANQINAEETLFFGDSSKKIDCSLTSSKIETDFVEKNISPLSQETNSNISLPVKELSLYDNTTLLEAHSLTDGSFSDNDFCVVDNEKTNKVVFYVLKNNFSSILPNYTIKIGTADGFDYSTKITNNKLEVTFSFDSYENIKNNFFNSNYFSKEIKVYSYSGYPYSFNLFSFLGENISSIIYHSSDENLSFTVNDSDLNSDSEIKIVKDNKYSSFMSKYSNRLSPKSITVKTIENSELTFNFDFEDSDNVHFVSGVRETFVGTVVKINWKYKYGSTAVERNFENKVSSNKDLYFLGDDFADDYVEFYKDVFYSEEHNDNPSEYWHTPLRLKSSKNQKYDYIFRNLFVQTLLKIEVKSIAIDSANETIFDSTSGQYNPNYIYGKKKYHDESNNLSEVVIGTELHSFLSTRCKLNNIIVSYYSRFKEVPPDSQNPLEARTVRKNYSR